MKLKKWLALALSAVMAVGVLAGCGGGSTGGGSLSLNEVNGLLADAGSKASVTADEDLDEAVKAAVSEMKADENFSSPAANAIVWEAMQWPSVSLTGVKAGGAYVIAEDDLEDGINAAALATFYNMDIDPDKLGDLKVVDSADEFAAAAVLAADTLVRQYLTESTIRQYVQNAELAEKLAAVLQDGVDIKYNVSARRTTYDGETYWVFGAQASAAPHVDLTVEE